jgi:hypothetical protein
MCVKFGLLHKKVIESSFSSDVMTIWKFYLDMQTFCGLKKRSLKFFKKLEQHLFTETEEDYLDNGWKSETRLIGIRYYRIWRPWSWLENSSTAAVKRQASWRRGGVWVDTCYQLDICHVTKGTNLPIETFRDNYHFSVLFLIRIMIKNT